MSGETEPFLYRGMSVEEEPESLCGSMSHLHRMGGASEGSDSSHDPPPSPRPQTQMHEDLEMGGNGSSGSGTESHSNEYHGNESVGSSSGNRKDSAIMTSSGSNKSSNSQSLSPPSSNKAFSLVSSEQDNPSTSGCSSEQSAKAKTQKELFKTLKELKYHLPPDKRSKGRASTLHGLRYALRCVKQVKANEEYYQMLMINDSQPSGLDVSSYTIEEINSITSEYTLKNADIFAVAVSLITGKIVYISDQAAGILNCRKDEFKDRKFVEFLTPRDVSVFYSFTTPYRLPSWSMCTGTESSSTEFMQEKSFFCRISGGKEKEGDLQYYPFRMTPYLMKVQLSEEHFCCLILAERVHSGYEAPRIPPDKRVFTTTHTPNCVFQDVDERAVPLLGYLPQDLIGTPLLLHLHPSDRPLMLAVHRKILQYVGQPFDHSSIRFCVRNGEYITLDTSWCSFVNPWSRKVSFVIGRHKVRMGPMNEDVFSAPACTEDRIMDSDIQEITEKIHRLLLQPVHSLGSSGYGSHGSNGTHELLLSIASSSDSNGNGNTANSGNRSIGNTRIEEDTKNKPRSFQEICKGVHLLKAQDQQGSASKPEQKKSSDIGFKSPVVKQKDSSLLVRDGPATMDELQDHTMHSYQQISCLDSVIRYLESCNIPNTVKRKYQFSSNTTSSNSDEDRNASDAILQQTEGPQIMQMPPSMSIKTNEKPPSGPAPVVEGPLSPLDLPSKADSVVSQCSYSSTIVHVGDKKTQPESEMIEDAAESPALSAAVSVVSPPTVEQEAYRKVELTKQVLAAHTQKEEQVFLSRCRELCYAQSLQRDCPPNLQRNRAQGEGARESKAGPGASGTEPITRKSWRTKKSKKPRTKHPDSSDNAASHHRPLPPLQGLNQTSWSPSETSQSGLSIPFPTVVPGYPLYPIVPPTAPPQAPTGITESQNTQATPTGPAYPTPLVTPVVAFVLPSFMLPQIGTAPRSSFYADTQQAYNPLFRTQQAYNTQSPFQPQQVFNTQSPFQPQQTFNGQQTFQPQQTFNGQQTFQPQQTFNGQQTFQPQPTHNIQQSLQPQQVYTNQQVFQSQQAYSTQQHIQNTQPHTSFTPQQPFTPPTPFSYGMTSDSKPSITEPAECPSPLPPPRSPPLFESRCSSPLQLDLLQMEEKQDSHSAAPSSAAQGNCRAVQDKNISVINSTSSAPDDLQQACCSGDGGHCGDHSSSSSVLDLLQEDSHSGTGSATSASTGFTFNDCNTSNSGKGSNTSKYFGSVDSSENNQKSEETQKEQNSAKYALQEPEWRLVSEADDCDMMTYQVPSRDMEKVLGEDRERLRRMQKNQPRFSSEQRRELIDQHPWMRRGGLPNAINVKECMFCEDEASVSLEEDLPDMELAILGEVGQDRGGSPSHEEGAQPSG